MGALRIDRQVQSDTLAASNTLDIDPAALTNAVDRYRSAALLGVQATRPRVSGYSNQHCSCSIIGHASNVLSTPPLRIGVLSPSSTWVEVGQPDQPGRTRPLS
jgi:hypothetical protein